jgi:hypothetical protein
MKKYLRDAMDKAEVSGWLLSAERSMLGETEEIVEILVVSEESVPGDLGSAGSVATRVLGVCLESRIDRSGPLKEKRKAVYFPSRCRLNLEILPF